MRVFNLFNFRYYADNFLFFTVKKRTDESTSVVLPAVSIRR